MEVQAVIRASTGTPIRILGGHCRHTGICTIQPRARTRHRNAADRSDTQARGRCRFRGKADGRRGRSQRQGKGQPEPNRRLFLPKQCRLRREECRQLLRLLPRVRECGQSDLARAGQSRVRSLGQIRRVRLSFNQCLPVRGRPLRGSQWTGTCHRFDEVRPCLSRRNLRHRERPVPVT